MRYNTGVNRKIVSCLVGLLAVVGLFVANPSSVFAQSTTDEESVVNYLRLNGVCDPENNPASCNCTFVFSEPGGSIVYATKGGSEVDNLGGNLIGVPRNHPLQWQAFVYQPDADDREQNCHSEQFESNRPYDRDQFIDDIDVACGWGSLDSVTEGAISAASFVACPFGAIAAAPFSSEFGQFIVNMFQGYWDGVGRYDYRCDFDPNIWTVTQPTRLKGIDEFGTLHRLAVMGERGTFGDDGTSGTDIHYCGLIITKSTRTEIAPADEEDLGQPYEICLQIPPVPDSTQQDNCFECLEQRNGIWTAIGCIPRDPQGMIQTIMGVGLSLAGGVCLLMMLAAGFTFSTSQGDPKKTGQAKEMMTSAIVGLVFILLSVTLLQFIGVSLLGIPGFGV